MRIWKICEKIHIFHGNINEIQSNYFFICLSVCFFTIISQITSIDFNAVFTVVFWQTSHCKHFVFVSFQLNHKSNSDKKINNCAVQAGEAANIIYV